MSSTTQKHKNFVSEPMHGKPVTELAGIGTVYGDRLKKAGFTKAYNVLGQYLVLDKNQPLFRQWMIDTCSATSKHADDCYYCLKEWCEQFL